MLNVNFKFIFPLLLLLTSCVTEIENKVERSNCLLENINQLNSIDPCDTNFADLQFLKHQIGDASIVMLGELGHTDGASFMAKTRLIKFLHKEMDFKVIAFESGQYDCYKAWQSFKNGTDYDTSFARGVFPVWAKSKQVDNLIQYIGENVNTNNELELAGFDIQLTGNLKPIQRIAELIKESKYFIKDFREEDYHDFLQIFYNQKKYFRYAGEGNIDSTEQIRIVEQLKGLLNKINGVHNHSQRYIFLKRYLINIERELYFKWHLDFRNMDPKIANLRDEEMAYNLLWLKEIVYPKEKMIVWGATSHLVSSRQFIDHKDEMKSMGEYVKKMYGEDCFIIGITCFDGRIGSVNRNIQFKVTTTSNKSIEYLLHHAGVKYCYLDRECFNCMDEYFTGRFLGFSNIKGRWGQMMDGAIYIDQMTANTSKYE